MYMSKRVRGSVSVLLCLVLLPMITYSTMIIDATRLQSVRSNIAGAGELTLNAIMSEYNTMLEEMYGLFANTSLMDSKDPKKKNEQIARALQSYFQQTVEDRFLPEIGRDGEYVQNTINGLVDKGLHATTHADEDELTDFLKLQLQSFSADPVTGSALANPNTMKRQIMEYMKFRGPVSIVSTIFGKLDYLKDSGNQADACDNKIEYTKKLGELQDPCLAAYEAIESEYNMGAMLINELVGQGITKTTDDHLKELIEDSKKQYEMASVFYMMDVQSPFNNTKFIQYPYENDPGNFLDYGRIGRTKFEGQIADKNIAHESNGCPYIKYTVDDYDDRLGAGEDGFDAKVWKHLDAMEQIVNDIRATGKYGNVGTNYTDQQFEQNVDTIHTNLTQPGRSLEPDGKTGNLAVYSSTGKAKDLISANRLSDSSSNHLHWFRIDGDNADLMKPFNLSTLPSETDSFDTQLSRAKWIYQIQLDIENKYKAEIADYAFEHMKLKAQYTRMNEIWEDLQRIMREEFAGRMSEKEQKLEEAKAHNRAEKKREEDFNPLHDRWAEKTQEEWHLIWEEDYKAWLANPDRDPKDKPQEFFEPVLDPPLDYWDETPIDYLQEWNTFCNWFDTNGSNRLNEMDKHRAALKQITWAMDCYAGNVNQFLTKATQHNRDYYLKYAGHYNESGYSGIAGAVMTLKMMSDGLHTANSKLQEILDIINTDKPDDKSLKTRQREWHDSITGENGMKGVNSDSTKAAMLSDYQTLADQFDENEVKDLKAIIAGDGGDDKGLIGQVDSMMKDLTDIKFLGVNLFTLQSAAKAFADTARQELEDKMKEHCNDFFNIGKSEIVKDLNEKAWQKILGDEVLPVYPSMEKFEDNDAFKKEQSAFSLKDSDANYVTKMAEKIVKDHYDDSSLYENGTTNYKKEISHFRVIDGILDSVGYAYTKEDKDKINLTQLNAEGSSALDEKEKFMITLYAEAKAAEEAKKHENEKPKETDDKKAPEDNLKDASKKQIDESKKDPTDSRDPKKLAHEEYGSLMEDIEKYCDQNKKNQPKEAPDIGNADPKEKNDGGGLKKAKQLLSDLATIGETAVENMYLEEYFTEMFTCRTDNQMLNSLTKDSDKKVLPVIMLNGYHNEAALKISPDKHLLNTETEWYGKEIEYLLWGKSDLNKNLTCTDAMIFAIRFALNAIYCFTAPDIQSYALELATAIAGWTVVGVPIVQVCITILIALAESGYDLYLLHDGRDVPIYKNQATFVCSPQGMLKKVATAAVEKLTDEVLESAAQSIEEKLDEKIDEYIKEGADWANSKVSDLSGKLESVVDDFGEAQIDAVISAVKKQFVTPVLNKVIPLGSLVDLSQKYGSIDTDQLVEDAVEEAMTVVKDNIKNHMEDGIAKRICEELISSYYNDVVKGIKDTLKDYFKKMKLPDFKDYDLEGALRSKLDDAIKPLKTTIRNEVKKAKEYITDQINQHADDAADTIKGLMHDKLEEATAQLCGKAHETSQKILNEIPEGKNLDTDAGSNITLNYKEYCKIFMLMFLSFGNQDAMLQRAGVLITCNMRHAVQKDGSGAIVQIGQETMKDFHIINANTVFSVNAQVDMVTLFPWPVKDVQDETSAETGLQLDLQSIRSSRMSINYCGINGY